MVQLSLAVPKKHYGAIIGKGGQQLQQLEKKHNVSIHLPARDSPATNILLTGEPDSCAACQRDIEQIIGMTIDDKPLETATFNISPSLFGLLIGTGGSILRQIETDTKCSITIPQRDSNEPVTAEGTADGIKALEQRFSKLLGESIRANTSSNQSSVIQQTGQQATQHESSSSSSIMTALGNLVQDKLHINLGLSSNTSGTSNTSRVSLRSVKEVLFFPENALHPGHFERFLELLRSATRSVDVAIYTLSDDRISRCLITLFEQGVKVRIFTEQSTMNDLGSDIQKLANIGIPVRYDTSPTLMHLKVAILDNCCVLSGSFNWTRSAAQGNTENIICTSSSGLVSAFIKQFEQMWPSGAVLPAK